MDKSQNFYALVSLATALMLVEDESQIAPIKAIMDHLMLGLPANEQNAIILGGTKAIGEALQEIAESAKGEL